MATMAEPGILLADRVFGESPRWHEDRLWFSDWGTQEVVAVELDGRSEVMARAPAPLPFCLDWRLDGRLLIVSGRQAKLLRQEPDGSLATEADLAGLASLWNEIVVDGRGHAYLNGGNYDPGPGGEFTP